jgi:hypothetical protein
MTFTPPGRRDPSVTTAGEGIICAGSVVLSKKRTAAGRTSAGGHSHVFYDCTTTTGGGQANCGAAIAVPTIMNNKLTNNKNSATVVVYSEDHGGVASVPLIEVTTVTLLSLTEMDQSDSSCDAFSDVSSLSSFDDDNMDGEGEEDEHRKGSAKYQHQHSPRSIFSSYWSQTCPIGLNRLPRVASATTADGTNNNDINKPNDDDSCVNSYERSLRHYEESKPPLWWAYGIQQEQPGLHRGFGNCQSLPQLVRPVPLTTTRKAVSTSMLETRRPPTCLRPSRRSTVGCHKQQQCASDCEQVSTSLSVVRFSDTVEIMEFTSPVVWAPKGWSTYFF